MKRKRACNAVVVPLIGLGIFAPVYGQSPQKPAIYRTPALAPSEESYDLESLIPGEPADSISIQAPSPTPKLSIESPDNLAPRKNWVTSHAAIVFNLCIF